MLDATGRTCLEIGHASSLRQFCLRHSCNTSAQTYGTAPDRDDPFSIRCLLNNHRVLCSTVRTLTAGNTLAPDAWLWGRDDEDRRRNRSALVFTRKSSRRHSAYRIHAYGKESDSGVFIGIPERPTEPWMPVSRGDEVEIGDWPDDLFMHHWRALHIHKSPGASNQTAPRMEHDGDNHGWAALSWCADNLLFNDLLITIDFEARDTLLRAARPEDFNMYGLIRGQRSQPEDDPLIMRREIA